MLTKEKNPKEVRVIIDLLPILKEKFSQETFSPTGLCEAVATLADDGIISPPEFDVLMSYIRQNRPLTLRTIASWIISTQAMTLWYPPYRKPERHNWIDKHIKKNARS